MPTCDILYPGLVETTGNATVTLSHGVRPSQFTIETAINSSLFPQVGTVSVVQDGDVVVQFPDCAIDGVFRSDGVETKYTVQILDRRWRWIRGGGVMVGHYNVRKPDKKRAFVEGSTKSIRELLNLCFENLGERAYDTSLVPSGIDFDQIPEIFWDYTPTYQALDELCSKVGMRIVLGTDNVVRVMPNGFGSPLPNLPTLVSDPSTIQSVALPDRLQFIAGPTVWQGLLELKPVGMDLDNQIKPIDELSYKPSEGWYAWSPDYPEYGVTYGSNNIEKAKAKQLAQQTVWKWYQVGGQLDGSMGPVPQYDGEVSHLWQYVIQDKLLENSEDSSGNIATLRPYVVGQWYQPNLGLPANSSVEPGNTTMDTRFPEPISIDQKNSVVQFSRAMYRINNDQYEPARLWLWCAYQIKEKNSRVPLRWHYTYPLPKPASGAGALPVVVPDVFLTIDVKSEFNGFGHSVTEIVTNQSEVMQAAQFYLNQKWQEIKPNEGIDATYAGFENISPNGLIQQVTWSLSAGVGMTRASTGCEHSIIGPRFKQRERWTKLEAIEAQLLATAKEIP